MFRTDASILVHRKYKWRIFSLNLCGFSVVLHAWQIQGLLFGDFSPSIFTPQLVESTDAEPANSEG